MRGRNITIAEDAPQNFKLAYEMQLARFLCNVTDRGQIGTRRRNRGASDRLFLNCSTALSDADIQMVVSDHITANLLPADGASRVPPGAMRYFPARPLGGW